MFVRPSLGRLFGRRPLAARVSTRSSAQTPVRRKALFEALDAAGRLDDTLVMFWNDHGEQLFEHGARGHAISLFGEETDGFALFWARGLSPAVWDEATTNLDLMPTALWLLDIDPPPGLAGDVVGTAPAERPVFGTVAPIGRPPQQSVTVGNRKLIYRWDGLKSLFLRDTDPAEANNVYDDNPAVVQAMWDLLLPEVERAEPFIADYTPESPGP